MKSIKTLNRTLAAAMVGLFAVGSASAADLMVTPTQMGNATEFTFEFVNDNQASAFEFELKFDGLAEKHVMTKSCTAGIFTNHSGTCQYKNGVFTMIVFSPSNEALPTFKVGSIVVKSPIQSLNRVTAQKLVVANTNGQQISGELLVDTSLVGDHSKQFGVEK